MLLSALCVVFQYEPELTFNSFFKRTLKSIILLNCFNEFLTSEYNEVWKEVVNLTNVAMVPTIEYKQEYLIPNRDYKNPEHLVQILKEMKESKEPYDRRTFERVKTLNYNMGMAFARLDKTLKELENKIK